MDELIPPVVVLIILFGVLCWALTKQAAEQSAALKRCYAQVEKGNKNPIDCRLMKLEFEVQNAQTSSNMAMGAAMGAAVSTGRRG